MASGVVEVTVRAMTGATLFGPAEVPESTAIWELAAQCGYAPSYECTRCGCKTSRRGHGRCSCDSCYNSRCSPDALVLCKVLEGGDELGAEVELSSLGKSTVQLTAVKTEAARCDAEVVLAAVRRHGEALRHAHERLRADTAIVLEAVRQNGSALRYADEALTADREVVLAAISAAPGGCFDGDKLRFAHESLRADRAVVLAAVSHFGSSLEYASTSLKADKEVVLSAVSNQHTPLFEGEKEALLFAHPSLRADREVILAAVRRSGAILQLLDGALRADREVVDAAVGSCGRALRFAHESLLADRDILLKALQGRSEDAFPIDEVPSSWMADWEVVRHMVSRDTSVFSRAHETLRKDKDAVMEVVRLDFSALRWADPSLQADKEVVLAALSKSRYASDSHNPLRFASAELRSDREVALQALRIQGARAWPFVSASLRGDPEIQQLMRLP